MTDSRGRIVNFTGIRGDGTSLKEDFDYINAFGALQAAFDPENPLIKEAESWVNENFKDVSSLTEYNDKINQFWDRFGFDINQTNGAINKLKDEDFNRLLSDNSLLDYPEYGVPIMKRLEPIIGAYKSLSDLLKIVNSFDFYAEGMKLPMDKTQEILYQRTGNPLFNMGTFGEFGTQGWREKVLEYANAHRELFAGGAEGTDFAKHIEKTYGVFLEFFNSMPKELQPFYYPYLNKTYWESLSGKVNLGELEGMYQPKDEQEAASMYPNLTFGSFGGHPAWFDNGSPVVPGFWAMPQIGGNVSQNQVQTPEQTVNSVSESLQAYTAPVVPIWPNGVPNAQENPVAQDSTLVNAVKEFAAPSVALANANVVPWREAVDRISYHSPWEPVTREEVDRATAEPLYAAFAPSYTPFMPPLSQTAVNNEDFRPAERQQVAMVARPVVININAERLVDFGTLNIENATDDAEIAQKVRNALEGILAEVAESTGGNYHFGVAS